MTAQTFTEFGPLTPDRCQRQATEAFVILKVVFFEREEKNERFSLFWIASPH